MSDARERFLREIADRLPPEQIEELHLFPPLRQGGVESGVAVVAADVESRDEPGGAASAEERQRTAERAQSAEASHRTAASAGEPQRHTVYTARYRHTLKGPDRGKWEFDLVAEADAPLITVSTVVRGVQKRSGELGDPERLSPDDLRTALDDAPWRATTR